MKNNLQFILLISLISSFTFFGCQKDVANELDKASSKQILSIDQKGQPNLKFKFKTTGTANLDSAKAYLDFIQLREKGTGNLVTIWNTGEWFNLLDMENGIMADIGFLVIPSGKYDRAICHVTYGWAFKNNTQTLVKFPGNQMIIKFSPAVLVGEHLSEELNIIMDVSNSFKFAINKYIFKPIVSVVNNTTDGRFVGGVIDATGNPLIGATITLSNGTNTFYTQSFPPIAELDNLMFLIPDVPAGTYTATASLSGYQNSSTTITILEGNYNSHLFIMQ